MARLASKDGIAAGQNAAAYLRGQAPKATRGPEWAPIAVVSYGPASGSTHLASCVHLGGGLGGYISSKLKAERLATEKAWARVGLVAPEPTMWGE